jgi:hypothetical protein
MESRFSQAFEGFVLILAKMEGKSFESHARKIKRTSTFAAQEALTRNRRYGPNSVVNTGHDCKLPGLCSELITFQQEGSVALHSLLATKSGRRAQLRNIESRSNANHRGRGELKP